LLERELKKRRDYKPVEIMRGQKLPSSNGWNILVRIESLYGIWVVAWLLPLALFVFADAAATAAAAAAADDDDDAVWLLSSWAMRVRVLSARMEEDMTVRHRSVLSIYFDKKQGDEWMNAWMDGWMDEWMDGWIDGWIDGWMNGWMNGWMDGWIDGLLLYVCSREHMLRRKERKGDG
jgi:hypothetical protein